MASGFSERNSARVQIPSKKSIQEVRNKCSPRVFYWDKGLPRTEGLDRGFGALDSDKKDEAELAALPRMRGWVEMDYFTGFPMKLG
jgi:hypothetical protein